MDADQNPYPPELVAYHKAGHAVAALRLRRGVYNATVVPNSEAAGSVQHRPLGPTIQPDCGEISARQERTLVGDVLLSLAGPCAERRLTGQEAVEGADGDLHRAVEVAHFLSATIVHDGVEEPPWPELERLSEALTTASWPAIVAVATALRSRHQLAATELRTIAGPITPAEQAVLDQIAPMVRDWRQLGRRRWRATVAARRAALIAEE